MILEHSFFFLGNCSNTIMKFSIYNSRVSVSEKTDVMFNAVTGISLFLPKNVRYENIEKIPANAMQTLVDGGFVVEDDIDEYQMVRDLNSKAIEDDSCFRLTINPTLNCNFRCWYCYETHKASQRMAVDTIDRVKRLISNILVRYPRLELSFFGGEPLMEFGSVVKPLIEYTKIESEKNGIEYIVSFTTNGFLFTRSMVEYLATCNCGILQITLDGGRENHNKTRVSRWINSFDTIVANVKMLLRYGLNVLLRINLTHENLNSAYEIPKYFEDLEEPLRQKLQIALQQVWQDSEKGDISDELWNLRSAFKKIGIFHAPKPSDYVTSICYADRIHSAVVNYNGDLYKCTAIDFDKEVRDGFLSADGDIVENGTRFSHRNEKRELKENCRQCRIMPLCNGGCSKTVSREEIGYCVYDNDAAKKDKLIISVIKESVFNNNL